MVTPGLTGGLVMRRVLFGVLMALAMGSAARANETQWMCKGAASDSVDLMIVQALVGQDSNFKGGIATLWLNGMRRDQPLSMLVLYDLAPGDADLSDPQRLIVFSRDPATKGAAEAVVTIGGAEYRGKWKAQKAPATGGTALIPGALKALTDLKARGADIGVSLVDKSGHPLATGQIYLPRGEEIDSSSGKALQSATLAASTRNEKMCLAVDENVNETSFKDQMHKNDFMAEGRATELLRPPRMGGPR